MYQIPHTFGIDIASVIERKSAVLALFDLANTIKILLKMNTDSTIHTCDILSNRDTAFKVLDILQRVIYPICYQKSIHLDIHPNTYIVELDRRRVLFTYTSMKLDGIHRGKYTGYMCGWVYDIIKRIEY